MAITFQFHYPIERTMAFEIEYHPNLRLTLADKRDLLQTRSAVSIWMFDGLASSAKPTASPGMARTT